MRLIVRELRPLRFEKGFTIHQMLAIPNYGHMVGRPHPEKINGRLRRCLAVRARSCEGQESTHWQPSFPSTATTAHAPKRTHQPANTSLEPGVRGLFSELLRPAERAFSLRFGPLSRAASASIDNSNFSISVCQDSIDSPYPSQRKAHCL